MAKSKKQQSKVLQTADSDMVIICLKHPQGIVFDLPRDNNGQKRHIKINGNAEELRGQEKGIIPSDGFGMTPVAKEDWEQIRKLYGNMRVFKSGLIFASGTEQQAADQSEEHDEIKSGMEPPAPDVAGVEEMKKEE